MKRILLCLLLVGCGGVKDDDTPPNGYGKDPGVASILKLPQMDEEGLVIVGGSDGKKFNRLFVDSEGRVKCVPK